MRCDICMSGEDDVELHVECGDCQEEHRKGEAKALAVAEARAYYWKVRTDYVTALAAHDVYTRTAVGRTPHAAGLAARVDEAAGREREALEKLRGLGAEP